MNDRQTVERAATTPSNAASGPKAASSGGRTTPGDYAVGGDVDRSREPAIADAIAFNEALGKPRGWWVALQRTLGVPATGAPDAATVQAIMTWQRAHALPPDGKVSADTDVELGKVGSNRPDQGLGDELKSLALVRKTLEAALPEQPDHLDAEEIERLRGLVAKLPEAERPTWYERLQRAAPYASQLDNKAMRGGESLASGMCNVTALAMDLQSLGIGKSKVIEALGDLEGAEGAAWLSQQRAQFAYGDATLDAWQLEDLLELLRRRHFPTLALTDNALYPKLCALVGADLTDYGSALAMGTQAFWIQLDQDALSQGKAVLLGHFGSLTHGGHILRLQEVTETGIIVDDPYGSYNWKVGDTNKTMDWGAANAAGPVAGQPKADRRGEDLAWSWAEVKTMSPDMWVKVMARTPEDPMTVAP